MSTDERLMAALSAEAVEANREHARTPSVSDSDEDSAQGMPDVSHEPLPTQPSRPGRQTGPKGVLADYAHYQELERQNRLAERRERAAVLARQNNLSASADQPRDREITEEEETERLLEELEKEEEKVEDQILLHYRQMRLREMQRERPFFGSLTDIRQSDYVDAIDREAKNVPVLIHIYEPDIPACHQLNNSLALLAKRYAYAKFLRILAHQASDTFEPEVLPALLCYRGGKLIKNLMRAHEEIVAAVSKDNETSRSFSEDGALNTRTLEAFLLQESVLGELELRTDLNSDSDELEYTDGEDDDDE